MRAQPALTISGRVLSDATGDPLANARIAVTPAVQGAPVALTDGNGRFSISVPPGQARIVASKSGYARSELTPAAGQTLEFKLARGAVISGRVVDQLGDPVPGTSVFLQPAPASATSPRLAITSTDDRGEYRLAGLAAGAFAVSVVRASVIATNGQTRTNFYQVYYPGVTEPERAPPLRLQSGEERSDVDFVVPVDLQMLYPAVMLARLSQQGGAPPKDPAATGIVRGRVTTADGRAVPHARVRLFTPADLMRTQVTLADDAGQFELREIAKGAFHVAALRDGYATTEASDRVIELSEGETRERVDLTLVRLGTVSGEIVDELGDPLQGASVQLLRLKYEAGRRRLVTAGEAALTDDLGRFHVFDISPGQYIVSASPGSILAADLPGYARSYFPGTPNPAAAQFISMAPAQDIAGIAFAMSRTATARVTGRALGADGGPAGGSLTLAPSQQSIVATSVGARRFPDGTFEFPNVPPGQYIIRADRGRSNSSTEGEFGVLPVSVGDRDVTGLLVQTSPGSAIAGRFTFDTYNNSKPPAQSALELVPLPGDVDQAPLNHASADIHADWTFEMKGINGPRRLELVRMPPEWALKEIRVNGIDATDRVLPFGRINQSLTGVEVVLTDRINTIAGTVADDRGQLAPGSSVIIFSVDRDRWYSSSRFLRIAAAGAGGAFSVAGLPYGSYYAAAVDKPPNDGDDAWQDPEFLRSLVTRASSVTLGDGHTVSLNLRLTAR
ncbi:MAG: carboxypeptidase-like regulatory domain-containing protein [Acidobacteriia bacterium]|nr:carboxypeptidase-like regulatory domain-containing protein [Terriglobia bacterium]